MENKGYFGNETKFYCYKSMRFSKYKVNNYGNLKNIKLFEEKLVITAIYKVSNIFIWKCFFKFLNIKE